MSTDEGRHRIAEAISQSVRRTFQQLLMADGSSDAARCGALAVVRCAVCGPHRI